MENITILDWITAISSIVTPILIVILTTIFTRSRSREERIFEAESKLQDDRIAVYNKILEPYIIASVPGVILQADKKYRGKDPGTVAASMITRSDYKDAEFKLFLMGSDGVVEAYNKLKQFFYSGGAVGSIEATKTTFILLAKLLIQIRKSVGNPNTKILYKDAIWWFLKDADEYF